MFGKTTGENQIYPIAFLGLINYIVTLFRAGKIIYLTRKILVEVAVIYR